jgi:hypothetical protein
VPQAIAVIATIRVKSNQRGRLMTRAIKRIADAAVRATAVERCINAKATVPSDERVPEDVERIANDRRPVAEHDAPPVPTSGRRCTGVRRRAHDAARFFELVSWCCWIAWVSSRI